MLRTCGLTDNEMKGRDAHDLKALACLFDKHSLPSDICHELGTLSSAYIAARYPSKGTEKVPAQKYSEAQARRAMGTAEKLVQVCGPSLIGSCVGRLMRVKVCRQSWGIAYGNSRRPPTRCVNCSCVIYKGHWAIYRKLLLSAASAISSLLVYDVCHICL